MIVHRELVLLYWQIIREILQRQEQEGWGSKVICRLAKDLKIAFPDQDPTRMSPRHIAHLQIVSSSRGGDRAQWG